MSAEASALVARGEALEAEERSHAIHEAELRQGLGALTARIAALSAAFDEADRSLTLARENTDGCRRALFESMNRSAEARNRNRALDESLERNRIARGARLAARESTHGDLARLEEQSARLEAEAEAQRGVLRSLEAEREALEARGAQTRERLSAESEALLNARERETSSSARLRTLEDVATRFAGVSEGVRVLLSSGASVGVRTHGVVADFVEAGEDIEAAAEAYLQALLPAVILEDDADARGAAELIRARGSGRTTFLCKTQPAGEPAVGAPANGRFPFPTHLLDDPRVLGRLRDRIRLKGANGFLDARIGDAVLVDRLDSALELHREHPQVDYLTAGGEVVYASGLVAAGGAKAAEQGLLAHTRRIHQTRLESAEAQTELASCTARVEALRSEVETLDADVARLRAHLEESRRKQMQLALHAERSGDEKNRTGRTAEMLAAELQHLEEEAVALEGEFSASRDAVAEAERLHTALESDLGARLKAQEALEAQIRKLSEEVGGLRADSAGMAQSLVAAERERDRRSAERQDAAARLEAATSGAAAARQRASDAAADLQRNEESRVRLLQEHDALAAEVSRGELSQEEGRRALAEREGGLREARTQLDGSRETLRAAELALAGADAERRHLDDLCLQELSVTATEASLSAGTAVDETTPEAVEEAIASIRQRIEAIGPVNMTAITEFTELEQRHGFLDAQRLDLENSMSSLRDTIRRINGTSRDKFLETFEAIRSSYQEIFQLLFGGGRADLRLEEGDDVLECGIEIMAQPPGKRLGSIQLMSGGEKAMSAIALLFAIFRNQPSPFCLLDEVDAALDDLNVNRFTRMLREYAGLTQFILITHNKISMDSANLLYGVTMDEPGVSRLVSLKLDA